jgi:protein-disulfide isomerase
MIESWRELAGIGHRIGPEGADVTVVVFSDFECPMCAVFANRTYADFSARYAGRTALVFRHWPLRVHRLAYPAAKASECAAKQGRFAEFHHVVFSQQEKLGLKSFHDFALEAGVPNPAVFDSCYADTGKVPAIERDIQVARGIGGIGTPTVLVNEWLLVGGVGAVLLDSIAGPYLEPGFGKGTG